MEVSEGVVKYLVVNLARVAIGEGLAAAFTLERLIGSM